MEPVTCIGGRAGMSNTWKEGMLGLLNQFYRGCIHCIILEHARISQLLACPNWRILSYTLCRDRETPDKSSAWPSSQIDVESRVMNPM